LDQHGSLFISSSEAITSGDGGFLLSGREKAG
jgi:hypothetical protein